MRHAAGSARSRSDPMPARGTVVALWALVIALLLALAGCTDGADPPQADDGEVVAAPTAAVTAPSNPEEPLDVPTATDGPTPPVPQPRPGEVVLVHLEGPVTDAAATDVVVRNERGREMDRFRLAGAIDVHAGSGSRWALVETLDGQWARYDATTGGLSLLTFDGDPPIGDPHLQGPLAWWEDPARPWLVRLDSAVAWSLRPQIGEGGSITAVGPGGAHVLVRGERDHVIDTVDGSTRTLPAQSAITLSADGATIASTAPATAGTDVYLEGIDGSGRRLIATVPAPGVPVLLANGRTVVLGAASRVVQPDGTLVDLPPTAGAVDPLLEAEGLRVVVTTEEGLAVVDPDAGTVTTVPGTAGYLTFDDGVHERVWAISAEADEPGAVVIDPATGTATPLLAGTPTTGIASISTDGRAVTVQVGDAGAMVVLARADGSVTELGEGALTAEAVVHPSGAIVAVAAVQDATRTLRIGEAGASGVEVPTGRSPVWLFTDS